MQIEKNMKENKPTFIIAQDIESGYNNVDWSNILETCRTKIIPNLQRQEEGVGEHSAGGKEEEEDPYKRGTFNLIKHIVTKPKLKIWKEWPEIQLTRGL